MKRKWHHVSRLLPLLALIALLSGCGKKGVSALEPLGKVAKEQLNLMILSFGIMIIVVVVVGTIFTYVIVKFRKRKGQDEDFIPEQVEGNTTLEILWTVIPIILLAILAFPTISKTFSISDTTVPKSQKDNTVVINVTANQFWWEFQYPDQKITTAQDVVIPTGKKVIFNLTSNDVIHSFWVPALGGKIDANPGQKTALWLETDNEGTYRGRCAELCGASHALMYFNVKAVSPDAYKTWLKEMKAGPKAPTTAAAKEGQALFKKNCMSCHAVGDKGGNIGPNLINFADRDNVAGIGDHTKKVAEKWITDPDKMKPGTKMIPFKDTLSQDQISKIADYLFTLTVKK